MSRNGQAKACPYAGHHSPAGLLGQLEKIEGQGADGGSVFCSFNKNKFCQGFVLCFRQDGNCFALVEAV